MYSVFKNTFKVKSKVKETTGKELLYKTEGKVQMTKIEENTRSGKGNVKA